MKAYRLSKGVTEHYTSLEELRKAIGLKPVTKQTRNKEKLTKQRYSFWSKHKKKKKKKPMAWTGGNVMACLNPQCPGIKHEQVLETGDVRVWYSPSYDLLDGLGSEIAENLFTEYDN